MANLQLRPPNFAFANSLRADLNNGELNPTNYGSIFNLRARLAAANGAYYTSAKLDQMTVNDMVFAVRSIDDRTTISNYMPVSTA